MGDTISSSLPRAADDSLGIADRLAWCGITQADFDRLRELQPIADELADQAIEAFYNHILALPDAASKFSDEQVLSRVKAGQKRYLKELTSGSCDESYVRERLRIGQIHERVGVGPALYIGAFDYYLGRLGQAVLARNASDHARCFELFLSLQKLAHFDISLALETYVEARERTIEFQQREMSELPTPVLKLRDGLLLIPVVGALDSHRARNLTIELLDSIKLHRARAVVLDITGVSTVDSAVANHFVQTMAAAQLMGARSILTGISPQVAQALVKIGVPAEILNTAGDLQRGIEMAEKLLGRSG